jgi:hypothetical protein
MLEGLDLRLVGIISLIIVIILGYIVYVMYQDVSVIKKDVDEINYKNNKQEDYEEYSDEEDHQHNHGEDYENFNLDGEDLTDFEQTINSYIEEEADGEYPDNPELETIEEEPEIKVKEKRKYNKKNKQLSEPEQLLEE